MGEDLAEWIKYGVDKGWVSEPFCFTHDGDSYMTEEELTAWDEGGDPCCHVVKLLDI